MHGMNTLKHYSRNQDLLGDSSAEDEYYAVCSVAKEGLGMQAEIAGLGDELNLVVHLDSSAAKAIGERQGLNRVRHIAYRFLWLQHYIKRQLFSLRKIRGDRNPADLFTKVVEEKKLEYLMSLMGLKTFEGRAPHALELQASVESISARSVLQLALIMAHRRAK